jgi:hypothetical protein
VASKAAGVKEATGAALSPRQGRSKRVRSRCVGRLLGQSLGPCRDEHGPFSICSKKSTGSNLKWSKRCLPLLDKIPIKYVFAEN